MNTENIQTMEEINDYIEYIEAEAWSYIGSIAPSDPNFDLHGLRDEYDAFIAGANAVISKYKLLK